MEPAARFHRQRHKARKEGSSSPDAAAAPVLLSVPFIYIASIPSKIANKFKSGFEKIHFEKERKNLETLSEFFASRGRHYPVTARDAKAHET